MEFVNSTHREMHAALEATPPEIIDFENDFTRALDLLDGARWDARFATPEGTALLDHYEGILRAAHAWGRQTRKYSGMLDVLTEIREAIAQWADHGELRCAGNPDFEALLRFHREED